MDLGTIASSALAAGVVSAAVNGLIAWRRAAADARERRNESRRAHLRETVLDLLSTAEQHFEQAAVHRRAIDDLRRRRAVAAEGTNALSLEVYKEAVALREVATRAWATVSRMRLYSDTLAPLAIELAAIEREPVVGLGGSQVLSDSEYFEALDQAHSRELQEYQDALSTFIAAARAELGIEGL